MFFLDESVLSKKFKRLRLELNENPIGEDLRGWNWSDKPVAPDHSDILLGVSELAGRYCETLRDIYIRRVRGIAPPPSYKMIRGLVFHDIIASCITEVKRILFKKGIVNGSYVAESLLRKTDSIVKEKISRAYERIGELEIREDEKLKRESKALFKYLVIQAASSIDKILSRFPHVDLDSLVNQAVPPIVERKVDGSLIGLSKELSADMYNPPLAVLDIKTGDVRSFHPLAPTGYALAIEASEDTPVNYGMIIYVRIRDPPLVPTITVREFIISNELRREFLDIRDEAADIVYHGHDPGKPPQCPRYCPYYSICHGG